MSAIADTPATLSPVFCDVCGEGARDSTQPVASVSQGEAKRGMPDGMCGVVSDTPRSIGVVTPLSYTVVRPSPGASEELSSTQRVMDPKRDQRSSWQSTHDDEAFLSEWQVLKHSDATHAQQPALSHHPAGNRSLAFNTTHHRYTDAVRSPSMQTPLLREDVSVVSFPQSPKHPRPHLPRPSPRRAFAFSSSQPPSVVAISLHACAQHDFMDLATPLTHAQSAL